MSDYSSPVYTIRGGNPLYGKVAVSGFKNAVDAILPAAILVSGKCRIENVPDISDVTMLKTILRQMGADIRESGGGVLEIDCSGVETHVAAFDAMRRIRASYYLTGALLGRFGRADTALPGGCNFGGPRPMDQHIKGFTAMGAELSLKNGIITATTGDNGLHGAHVSFDVVSVGATINVMLGAVLADGLTVLENAAREPHIVDVAAFLNYMGADIRGAGTETIRIRGQKRLSGGEYTIIPDQIEAGTFMAAAAGTGGEVEVCNVIPRHLECISVKLREMGVSVTEKEDSVVVRSDGRLRAVNLKTMPYPGFPTDIQPQISALLCFASGRSRVTEGIWPDRFRYLDELMKMGAKTHVAGATAIIDGVPALTGAPLKATDLRAGAALVIAGLCARGTTDIEGVEYIERGYENIVGKLRSLGADIISTSRADNPPARERAISR